MSPLDERGRPEPPLAADELGTLVGFLEFQRATVAWKCRGLDAVGLAATTAASSMTLGGLLKHLALVEDLWFSRWLLGNDPAPPFDSESSAADQDWPWTSAAADSVDELWAIWEGAVARSRRHLDAAMAAAGLAQRASGIPAEWGDEAPTLRWILCHMVEEYSRHAGHADLLREAIDGQTGE